MGIHQALSQETVSEMPLRRALTVKPGTPVRLAVAEMKKRRIGAAIVVDAEQKPLGIFTERILVRALAADPKRLDQPIDDHVIDCSQLTVRLDDPVARVIHAMQNSGIRFICVVDEQGKVHSLAGFRGVIEWVVEHFPRAVKVQGLEAKLYLDEREGA